MGDPTVYRIPRKSISPRQPSKSARRKWENHRKATGKSPKLPALKK